MKLFTMRKRSSSLALAIALATGSAVVATAVYPAEAHAQRKKKKDQEENGGGYSKEFVAAYQPIDDGLKAEGADAAAYKPQLEALIPLSNSNDEKIAAGGLIFNTGIKLNDQRRQRLAFDCSCGRSRCCPEPHRKRGPSQFHPSGRPRRRWT